MGYIFMTNNTESLVTSLKEKNVQLDGRAVVEEGLSALKLPVRSFMSSSLLVL